MKIYKKIMNALAAVEKIVLVISTLLILVLTVGNVFPPFLVLHRRTCSSGIRTHHPAGSRTGLPRRRTGQPDTGHRPSSKEAEETIRDPDHSPEHHLQRHPFQIRNGQGNHSASEWKKNLRIKLA